MTSLLPRTLLLAVLLALGACRSTPEQPPADAPAEAGSGDDAAGAGSRDDGADGATATDARFGAAGAGPASSQGPGLLEPGRDGVPARAGDEPAGEGDEQEEEGREDDPGAAAPPATPGPSAPATTGGTVTPGAPTVTGAAPIPGAASRVSPADPTAATGGAPGDDATAGDDAAPGDRAAWREGPGEGPGAAARPARAGEGQAYAAWARERAGRLDRALKDILEVTTDAFRAERDELSRAVAELPVPLVLSARDRHLRTWGADQRRQYQEAVSALYDDAQATLEQLFERAMDEAESRARAMATERSPLDAGASGEPLLDRELMVFDETLRDAVNFPELDAQRQLDVLGRLELVEAYSSFTSPGADARLGGRLLLYVGGSELSSTPLAGAVLRLHEDTDPRDRFVVQAVRHRILRGDTLVQDLGWRVMPPGDGWAELQLHAERYLVAKDLAPRLDSSAPAFDALRDMRVVVDLQTAIVSTREPPPAPDAADDQPPNGGPAARASQVVDRAAEAAVEGAEDPADADADADPDADADAGADVDDTAADAALRPHELERGAVIAGPDVWTYGPPVPLPGRPPDGAPRHVLGGVNWRLEFRVTFRGVVSWQIAAAAPVFDPECAQVEALLER